MAETIWKSIFFSVAAPVVLSWGVSSRTATWYRDMPALMLTVSGMLHKGRVIIAYNEGTDYYEVFLLSSGGRCIRQMADICFDELGIVLDECIERPSGMSDADYRSGSLADSMRALVGG